MPSYQKIVVVGNLGQDPELRYTPQTSAAVCSFSVAYNEKFKASNGDLVEHKAWFRVSAWGKIAESCNQYLKKGSLVVVEGTLISDDETGGPRLWKKKDGSPGASFEIKAQNVRFLSRVEGKPEEQSEF